MTLMVAKHISAQEPVVGSIAADSDPNHRLKLVVQLLSTLVEEADALDVDDLLSSLTDLMERFSIAYGSHPSLSSLGCRVLLRRPGVYLVHWCSSCRTPLVTKATDVAACCAACEAER